MNFLARYELVEVGEIEGTEGVPGIRSERARRVAKWFGIEGVVREKKAASRVAGDMGGGIVVPKVGEIVLVMGASGAGKSSMLRGMRSIPMGGEWVDLNEICLPEVPIVDCFLGMELGEVLAVLSRVGLAEAWSYLRFPSELSEGQRWRLKLAVGMSAKPQGEGGEYLGAGVAMGGSAKPQADGGTHWRSRGGGRKREGMIFVADEFAALLDRVTAGVVGRCLRRVVDSSEGLGAVVATSHEDLVGALRPDRIVWCDFRRVEVWRKKASHGKAVGFCGSGSLKERCRVSGRTRR